jgi:hypothetical protein
LSFSVALQRNLGSWTNVPGFHTQAKFRHLVPVVEDGKSFVYQMGQSFLYDTRIREEFFLEQKCLIHQHKFSFGSKS